MKTNKKRKGFTLIELIAVIAIIGILAVVIVPRVSNQTAKATAAKHLANAKTLAQAIEMYNTNQTVTANVIDAGDTITDEGTKGKLVPDYLSSWPSESDLATITAADDGATEGSYGALLKYLETHTVN